MRAVVTVLVAVVASLLVSAGSVGQERKPGGGGGGGTSCSLDDVSFMAFGSYDPMSGAPVDMLGQISYRCFNKIALSDPTAKPPDFSSIPIEISISQGVSNSFHRRMPGGRDYLSYNLYIDPLHANIWGDGTPGTSIYQAVVVPNNRVETVPVFGRIFGGQDVTFGQYLDNVVVTLDF